MAIHCTENDSIWTQNHAKEKNNQYNSTLYIFSVLQNTN